MASPYAKFGAKVKAARRAAREWRLGRLELRFDIHKAGVQRIRPTLENVRLYCTPVVNLFQHDAIPIRLDGKQDQYLLLPAEFDSQHCGVFSVDRVTGWKPGGMGYEEYVPFESFEHDSSFDQPRAGIPEQSRVPEVETLVLREAAPGDAVEYGQFGRATVTS